MPSRVRRTKTVDSRGPGSKATTVSRGLGSKSQVAAVSRRSLAIRRGTVRDEDLTGHRKDRPGDEHLDDASAARDLADDDAGEE